MSTYIEGNPSQVELNPSLPNNVTATTFATPIVATTVIPHGLLPGDYFQISGATDPAANGRWMAGTVTASTVVLLTAPGGLNSVGTLAGGAAGFLLALGFVVQFPIPSGGDKPDSASVGVPFEALADRTAFLEAAHQDARSTTDAWAPTNLMDLALSDNWIFGPLTANMNMVASAIREGHSYSLTVKQDGVGGHTVGFSADFIFGSTYTNVVGATANKSTVWLFRGMLLPGTSTVRLYCVGKETGL